MCDVCTEDGDQPGASRRQVLRGAGVAAMLALSGQALALDRHRGRRAIPRAAKPVAPAHSTANAKAAPEPKAPPKPENVTSPDEALKRLMAGNARYVSGAMRPHDFAAERAALAVGQNPFAGILSCADSRVAPEYAFDAGRGDLFVVRVAGNFLNDDNLASFEYAVAVLKTPLLMVLGHANCGAVEATIKSLKDSMVPPGHIPLLVASLAPAVRAVLNKPGDTLENATKENIRLNVARLKAATPVLSAAVQSGALKVVGGYYDLRTGNVELVT